MINNIKQKLTKGAPLRGFSLIEALVSVLILTAAITGPLSIAAQGFQGALVARDQITAFFLAQDAVEFVQFVRATNRLNNYGWLSGGASGVVLTACVSAGGSATCYFDSMQTAVSACSGACPAFLYDSSTRVYNYDTGVQTPQKFTRTVKIETPVGGSFGEAALTVTVSWQDQGLLTRSVTVREHITDWQ